MNYDGANKAGYLILYDLLSSSLVKVSFLGYNRVQSNNRTGMQARSWTFPEKGCRASRRCAWANKKKRGTQEQGHQAARPQE
jgi:hypothetical protein